MACTARQPGDAPANHDFVAVPFEQSTVLAIAIEGGFVAGERTPVLASDGIDSPHAAQGDRFAQLVAQLVAQGEGFF